MRATRLLPQTVETVSKFVKRGGDCELHIGLYPPLTLASMDGLYEMCKLLLSGGAVGVRLWLNHPALQAHGIHALASMCISLTQSTLHTQHVRTVSRCKQLKTRYTARYGP